MKNTFFSPPVRTYSILAPHHEACQIVDKLITMGCIQFEMISYDDSSDPFYMIYSRIKHLKFKLVKLIEMVDQKYEVSIKCLTNQQKTTVIDKMKTFIKLQHIDYLKYLDLEEHKIDSELDQFNTLIANYDRVLQNLENVQEEIDTLKFKATILKQDFASEQFAILTGTCLKKDKAMIEKLLFRKTHGHCYTLFKDRPSGRDVMICFINKMVFNRIRDKLLNIFNLNQAHLYELPNLEKHLVSYHQDLEKKHREIGTLFFLSNQQLMTTLRTTINNPETSLQHHLTKVIFLERLIYIICHSKKIGSPSNHVVFTVHIPDGEEFPQLAVPVIPILGQHKQRTIMPRLPCLYEVNMLTELYSTPKFNEIIPSIFMFATVPILFGMMFSDVGHGLMLLALSFYLKLGPLFYFMSFMSMYCGFIYNEFLGMKVFRTQNLGVVQGVWGVAENGMNFQNSLKMKISMIIAFVHMTFGLGLKIVNELKRGQNKSILYDSLPKLFLLFSTVGYLNLLIISKWLTNYSGIQSHAPSIINTMLELYLGSNTKRTISVLGSMEREEFYGNLSKYVCVICILVMVYNHTFRRKIELYFHFEFFNKNTLKSQGRTIQRNKYQNLHQEDLDEQIDQDLSENSRNSNQNLSKATSNYYEEESEHESELGPLEVFEYILSLISSTTSYLRLFALSLAHAKLSHLLLTFLLSSLSEYHPYVSVLRCIIFFAATAGLMLMLDVMECSMHVVRLHWVEWMGKFYTGSGTIFKPEIQEYYQ